MLSFRMSEHKISTLMNNINILLKKHKEGKQMKYTLMHKQKMVLEMQLEVNYSLTQNPLFL